MKLNQAEATLIYYALEELAINRHPDDFPPGPAFDQLSELLTKFEKLTNDLKQNKL